LIEILNTKNLITGADIANECKEAGYRCLKENIHGSFISIKHFLPFAELM
jgi:hypothetical protein